MANSPDLERLVGSYSGLTKIKRCLHIADHCVTAKLSSLTIAVEELQKSINTTLYSTVCERLNAIQGSKVAYDEHWVEKTNKLARQQQEKIEADLNANRSSHVKERIRQGYLSLGIFHFNRGDLQSALNCFSRTNDYNSTPQHILETCLHMVHLCIQLENYTLAYSYAAKAEMTGVFTDDPNVLIARYSANALSSLNNKNFKAAARSFLELPSFFQQLPDDNDYYGDGGGGDGDGDGEKQDRRRVKIKPFQTELEVTSINETFHVCPGDCAVYGSLLALGSLDRKECKRLILGSSYVMQCLEQFPHVREFCLNFLDAKFRSAFTCFEKYLKPVLPLDRNFAASLPEVSSRIRSTSLLQYFSPFVTIDIARMAETFDCTRDELEDELVELIQSGDLHARIDRQKGQLRARSEDQRSVTMGEIEILQDSFERLTQASLLRTKLFAAGVGIISSSPSSSSYVGGDGDDGDDHHISTGRDKKRSRIQAKLHDHREREQRYRVPRDRGGDDGVGGRRGVGEDPTIRFRRMNMAQQQQRSFGRGDDG